MNTADTYLIKALGNYPWDIEEAMEAVEYGLSYDGEHAALLCLKGRICAEQLHQYDDALCYFENALAADLNYPETYYHYLDLLIKVEQLDKATLLIEQALKVPGIDKYTIYLNKSGMFEQQMQFKEALDMITITRRHCYNKPASDFLDEEVNRINKKMDEGYGENKKEEPRKKSFFERLGIKKSEKKYFFSLLRKLIAQ